MRQLYYIGPQQLEWRQAPDARLEAPTDALVRPIAVAACDGDVAGIRGTLPLAGPFSMGHEFVAEVLELGEDVREFKPGQLIVLPVQISCGQCARCTAGYTADCRGVSQPAAWGLGAFGGNWPGAFSDLLRIPYASHMMVPVPEGVSIEAVGAPGTTSRTLGGPWRHTWWIRPAPPCS